MEDVNVSRNMAFLVLYILVFQITLLFFCGNFTQGVVSYEICVVVVKYTISDFCLVFQM
ncbi:hypothetical protein Plhal304r1_c080g0166411 [Plasmopara halstedii]